jgi:hypothetical protein
MSRLRGGLIDDALATWESIPASDWFPGVPLSPASHGGMITGASESIGESY